MNDIVFDTIIEKLTAKLVNKSEVVNENEILYSYKESDWDNWLLDIIEIKITYPISKISSDGDIISDMVLYLKENLISTKYYERSVGNLLIATYSQNPNNTILLERLIDALIHLSGNTANKTLIKLLTSRINSTQLGRNSYLKTCSLLALSKSHFLENDSKINILNYVVLQGIYEMKHDPYFYSNCLRFCYLQISVKSFFDLLTIIVAEINKWENVKDKEIILHLLVDKIEELFYFNTPIFHKNLFNWLIENHNPEDLNSLFHNEYSKRLISILATLIDMNAFALIAPNIIKLDEIYYKDSVEVLISILINQDISSSKHLSNPEHLIDLFSFIGEVSISCFNLIKIVQHENNFIVSVNIRLIPEIIEKQKLVNDSFLVQLVDSIEEITSGNTNMESSKLAIISFFSL